MDDDPFACDEDPFACGDNDDVVDDDPFAFDDDDDGKVDEDPFACDDDEDPFDCDDTEEKVEDDPFDQEELVVVEEDEEEGKATTSTPKHNEKDESDTYISNTPASLEEYVGMVLKKYGDVLNSIYRRAVRERAEREFKHRLDQYKLEDMNRRLNLPTKNERQVMDFASCSKQDAKQALEMCAGDVSSAINLFLQGILRSNPPVHGAPVPQSLVSMSTEELSTKRKRDILNEHVRQFTRRWKHVITNLSKRAREFLLRDGTKMIWEQLLLFVKESSGNSGDTKEHDDVDRILHCLDRFANSVATTKRKDFLRQLLKPESLQWLWRQVSTSGNGENYFQYLENILRRKTPSSEYALKFGQVELCSDEINSSELTKLCSCMKDFSVSCSNSYVLIDGGRDVETNQVSNKIYCLYPSVLDVDPPRLPSVYVTCVSSNGYRYGHASAIVLDSGYYFVCGGQDKSGCFYENETFWCVAKLDMDGTSMSWISQQQTNKICPTPRSGHCVVPFQTLKEKRAGIVCFGGIEAKTNKLCTDIWMMWMDDTNTWISMRSSNKVQIQSNVSGYCIESRKDDVVVMSLCDANGRVIYATISLLRLEVTWNEYLESPRILTTSTTMKQHTAVPAAHVRMFDDSLYFNIEAFQKNGAQIRVSSDSCCHQIQAPCEIALPRPNTRLIPLLLPHASLFHKTIPSLMIFSNDSNVSSIAKVLSFRDLNRPTIVRDSAIDFGVPHGAARSSVARFNSRFGSDITFMATRRSDKTLVSALHFSSDIMSLSLPEWYRDVESDGKRSRLVMDMTKCGISYEALAEYLYCMFAQTREEKNDSDDDSKWIGSVLDNEDVELIRDMWSVIEVPTNRGTIRTDLFRSMILSRSKMHCLIRNSRQYVWIKKMRDNIVKCILTPTKFNEMHRILRSLQTHDLVSLVISCWQGSFVENVGSGDAMKAMMSALSSFYRFSEDDDVEILRKTCRDFLGVVFPMGSRRCSRTFLNHDVALGMLLFCYRHGALLKSRTEKQKESHQALLAVLCAGIVSRKTIVKFYGSILKDCDMKGLSECIIITSLTSPHESETMIRELFSCCGGENKKKLVEVSFMTVSNLLDTDVFLLSSSSSNMLSCSLTPRCVAQHVYRGADLNARSDLIDVSKHLSSIRTICARLYCYYDVNDDSVVDKNMLNRLHDEMSNCWHKALLRHAVLKGGHVRDSLFRDIRLSLSWIGKIRFRVVLRGISHHARLEDESGKRILLDIDFGEKVLNWNQFRKCLVAADGWEWC